MAVTQQLARIPAEYLAACRQSASASGGGATGPQGTPDHPVWTGLTSSQRPGRLFMSDIQLWVSVSDI